MCDRTFSYIRAQHLFKKAYTGHIQKFKTHSFIYYINTIERNVLLADILICNYYNQITVS